MGYSVEQSTASAWHTLLYALAYNLGALLAVATFWGLCHRWIMWERMLAPRNTLGERGAFVKPMRMRPLIKRVVGATEEEVIHHCGFDAAVYVRFFTMCIQMYAVLVVVVLPTLAITYAFGDNPNGVTGVNSVSLSNVNNKSTTMWITLSMFYFQTIITLYLIWRHSQYVYAMRLRYFETKAKKMETHSYTVLVTCFSPDSADQVLPERLANHPHPFSLADFWLATKSMWKLLQNLVCGCCCSCLCPWYTRKDNKGEPQGSQTLLNGAAGGKARGTAEGDEGSEGHVNGEGGPTDMPRLQSMGKDVSPYPVLPSQHQNALAIDKYMRTLFGDSVLRVQPIYSFNLVWGPYNKFMHAVRMLNRSRIRWEQNQEKKSRDAEKQRSKGRGAQGEVMEEEVEDASLKHSGEGMAAGKEVGLEAEGTDVWPRHKADKPLYGLCGGGHEVESIPYWIEEVQARAAALSAAQELARDSPFPDAAFVIFNHQKDAVICRETLRAQGALSWEAKVAPPEQEVWWDNLNIPREQHQLRIVGANFYTVLMTIFFYIPCTLIASLASGKALTTSIGQQKEEVQTTWLPPALQAIVPSLALHSVLWIFSPLFMLVARWEGHISLGNAMVVSSSRFYYVTVINVLIAYSLTASLFSEIQAILNHEITVSELLAASIPSTAAFFMQYTLNSSLMCGMELGRLPIHIVCYLVKYVILGRKVSDTERLWDQGPMAYHVFVSYMNLIMTFGIVYCVIQPLILPFSLLYFLIAYFTWKHELMYIYKDPADQGGIYWPRLVHHVFNALYIGQVTTIGIMSSKQAYTQAGLATLAFILTLIVHHISDAVYMPHYKRDAFETTARAEASDAMALLEDPERFSTAYYPVWMKAPVLPNLDPHAPHDPHIWKYLHPFWKDYYEKQDKGTEGSPHSDDSHKGSDADPGQEAFERIASR